MAHIGLGLRVHLFAARMCSDCSINSFLLKAQAMLFIVINVLQSYI